jgi:hypothetical protein
MTPRAKEAHSHGTKRGARNRLMATRCDSLPVVRGQGGSPQRGET